MKQERLRGRHNAGCLQGNVFPAVDLGPRADEEALADRWHAIPGHIQVRDVAEPVHRRGQQAENHEVPANMAPALIGG